MIDWRDPSMMHRRPTRLGRLFDEAQAKAPKGWAVNGIQARRGFWRAWAVRVGWTDSWGQQPTVTGYGPTEAMALRQLGARLEGGGTQDADRLWNGPPFGDENPPASWFARRSEIREWYAKNCGETFAGTPSSESLREAP